MSVTAPFWLVVMFELSVPLGWFAGRRSAKGGSRDRSGVGDTQSTNPW